MERVKLIGTSHIAAQSVKEIQEAIKSYQPDIIAVELDVQRAAALFEKQRRKIPLSQAIHIGLKGYLFAKVGQLVQQRLGKMVGMAPGSDMKAAIEIARKEKKEIALIDQPIQITLRRFSKSLTWKDRFQFFKDLLQGLFSPKKQAAELGLTKFDLRTVPTQDVIKKMMKQLQKKYPSVYKVLVEERNQYMVKKIITLLRNNPEKKILAVVGAGHQEGMEELLLRVDVIS